MTPGPLRDGFGAVWGFVYFRGVPAALDNEFVVVSCKLLTGVQTVARRDRQQARQTENRENAGVPWAKRIEHGEPYSSEQMDMQESNALYSGVMTSSAAHGASSRHWLTHS